MDCHKSRLVKVLLPLTSFPTHGLFLSLLPNKNKIQSIVLNFKETPQAPLVVFNMACRHVKLKLLEPTHLSKGF